MTTHYLLTGAASGLGQDLIRALVAAPDARVVGLVGGRQAPAFVHERVTYLTQDLRTPLSAEAAAAAIAADRVVHLAWSRAGEAEQVLADNQRMLDTLLAVPGVAARLVFVSSVAASPRALGGYGRAKHAVQQRVLDTGGTAVVVGLVVGDPPETAFKTLVAILKRLPVGLRLIPNTPRIYPVLKSDAVDVLATVVRQSPPPAAYRAFLAAGVPINEFFGWIERRQSLRRPHVPVPQPLIALAMHGARFAGLTKLAEKLGTFFFKDEQALKGLREPPGTALAATRAAFSPAAAAPSRNT